MKLNQEFLPFTEKPRGSWGIPGDFLLPIPPPPPAATPALVSWRGNLAPAEAEASQIFPPVCFLWILSPSGLLEATSHIQSGS